MIFSAVGVWAKSDSEPEFTHAEFFLDDAITELLHARVNDMKVITSKQQAASSKQQAASSKQQAASSKQH